MNKIEIILLFTFFFHFIKSQKTELNSINEDNISLNITKFVIKLAQAALMETLTNTKLNLSEKCINNINITYNNSKSNYYSIFYYDSQKVKMI